ncbi:MAG: hypothetical protein ACJ8DJ_01925 [Gemmatimonadales bacterium]
MSRNLELVRSICEPWQPGDFGELTWADAEIEFVAADGPHPVASRGLRSLLQRWSGAVVAWEGFRVPVEGLREIGPERVLVLCSSAGGEPNGGGAGKAERREALVFSVSGERVVRLVVYRDAARALADLGLGE